MAVYAALNSFNAGELSSKMLGRSDVSQYNKGCCALRNFLVTPYGSVERRPGTIFVAETKTATSAVRLIPFIYSSGIAYICEFGDKYIRLYKEDRLKCEIVSPYPAHALHDLKFVQSADVMFIVHPDFPVHELKRKEEAIFSIAEMEFSYPPALDPNLNDDIDITPSGVKGDITLAVTLPKNYDGDAVFHAGNAGGFFEIIHTRHENDISKDFTANATSEPLEVYGYWSLNTHGTWTGTLKLQRSFDGGATWDEYRIYSSAKDKNVSTSGEEKYENALYRLVMEDYSESATGTLKMCRALLNNPDFVVTGVVKITGVTDSTHATGTVLKKLGGTTATHEWNEGAFSQRRGFPRTVAFYEERMMFGGTRFKPQTVWGSKTNDWNHFLLDGNDDSGIEFTLASDTVNTICWMCQHDALVIGTVDSEWTLSASTSDAALTPSNIKVKRQSVYGSSGIAAKMVGDVILFVQRQGRKVREFVYTWEKDGYVSPDLTILADHITQSGIVESTLQQQPDTILWCLLGDGTIAAMTYERDQEVCGWHKHVTAGAFKSLAVIPSAVEDVLYVVVERNNKRTIERFAGREWNGIENCCFLDSAVIRRGAMSEVTGLEHLEGMTIDVLADGAVQKSKSVANGKITLDNPAKTVVAGVGFASLLSPMPIEIETQNGLSLLRRKAISELRIRVYNSVGGSARAGDDTFREIISRSVLLDDVNSAISPKSEVVQIQTRGAYKTCTNIEVMQNEPLPLNVAAIVAIYEVTE